MELQMQKFILQMCIEYILEISDHVVMKMNLKAKNPRTNKVKRIHLNQIQHRDQHLSLHLQILHQ